MLCSTAVSRCPVVLLKFVRPLHHLRDESALALRDEGLHVRVRLFVRHLQMEAFPKFIKLSFRVFRTPRYPRYVRDVGILHEHHEVDEQLGPPTQDDVRLGAVLLELSVVRRTVPSHPLHHLLHEFEWRRERFRVSSQNVTKIDVAQIPRRAQEHVVKMSIADAHEVCDDAIAGTALDERLHRVFLYSIGAVWIWIMLPQKLLNVLSVLCQHF
mmetsp:Transcript_3980/g.8050  ORF Transcript_3980/g.8050 Transcript_3980/m.8050 type:complete len:213 (+) Transcript_3980:280-918(+)